MHGVAFLIRPYLRHPIAGGGLPAALHFCAKNTLKYAALFADQYSYPGRIF